MTYKIAVVGDKDSILPFKMLGFDIFPTRFATQARALLTQLEKDGYGIVYITEQLANDMIDVIEKYKTQIIPTVILIPSYKGTLNIGMTTIQANVEKAIGTNIL